MVIEGDLTQALGTPVERGESLFTIAPLQGYRIILKVDESDILTVKEGQKGKLVLASLPNTPLSFEVKKITAAANAQGGNNIFRVEATLENPLDTLRPGMQGVGKITIGRESLWWLWSHKLTDSIRLWLWLWIP